MKLCIIFLAVCLSLAAAEIVPRFPGSQPININEGTATGNITGTVLPCDFDYWRLESFTTIRTWNYLRVEFNQTGDEDHPTDLGAFYIVRSTYANLEKELADNDNIVDTLGELPGPDNYEYRCTTAKCIIEISCDLANGTYYIAIGGGQSAAIDYSFSLYLGAVTTRTLENAVAVPVLQDQRPDQPPVARALNYAYWTIDIPESAYSEYTYLTVNVSRVAAPGLTMRLHYDRLPEAGVDVGVLDVPKDDCIYEYCVDVARPTDASPFFEHPVNTQPRIPCLCLTQEQDTGFGVQLTCNLTVDPCHFQYGKWYISLELPPRDQPENPLDETGVTDYTLTALVESPSVTTLFRNTTFKGFAHPEAMTHYKIVVPTGQVKEGQSHFTVNINNIRGGFLDVFVHRAQNSQDTLAGGLESCGAANVTCHTRDACNIVVEKCQFTAGTWYIGVQVSYEDGHFLVDDCERLPITYTIRANWAEDATPQVIVAGVPVHKYIGEALYDFYVVDVPATIDTWLFVELYTKAEDSEVIISMLHGDLPGGECYARPDFYCLTGDFRGKQLTTGPPQEEPRDVKWRESCQFMIQTCELTPGPLYISVYGHHVGYVTTGDTTYYQVPVHYTLWVDFDVAMAVHSGVSYSETVHERHYQHYYIRADNIDEGSWLSVELTNIQHGIPQTLEAFVNYNFLAGSCPCFDHLYNCTGSTASCGSNSDFGTMPRNDDITQTCCTIVVPACAFRSGVWYIGVLGINENLVRYTTPIGYTLTATIHDAPVISALVPGQVYTGVVPQWNETNQYVHYRLGAKRIADHDLVLKLTYVQNCDFLAKHDNLRDTLRLFVNRAGVAGGACYDYHCEAHILGHSYCHVVIPSCEWADEDYFVAIHGDYSAIFDGRYTLTASIEQVKDVELTSGISITNKVPEGRYQHYFIDVPRLGEEYLLIDLYTNSDQDKVTAYLNADDRAGAAPCYENSAACLTQTSCSWQIEACNLKAGRYYVSVFGEWHQFYDIHVEYTLTAYLKSIVTPLTSGDPFTGHIHKGQVQHYQYWYETQNTGEFLLFEIDNVQNGVVEVFYNYGDLAGECPCYGHTKSCLADSSYTAGCDDSDDTTTPNWCQIRVAPCELQTGIHYFSVVGREQNTPQAFVYETPIGYTVELQIIRPNVFSPNVERDRFVENQLRFQFLKNNRYNHYIVDVSEADWNAGFHVVVEITNVKDGALNVYFNDEQPADESCQIATLCNTNGLGPGGSCLWQVPFCLTKPGRHYVSVEGITGRIQASYDILIYLERPGNVDQNQFFTLDINEDYPPEFSSLSELNVTHDKNNEPRGWVQFIRLNELATSDLSDGEILEIFFYRVINNVNEPLEFNVYLWPERPAGPHDCCDVDASEAASCLGAPCLRTVPLTTYNPGFISVPFYSGGDPVYGPDGEREDSQNNNLCYFNGETGNGADPSEGDSPYYGGRCTVRVWACDLNAHASSTAADWWLTVVPAADPNPLAGDALRGLSYSVQWRVRDTRLDANTGVVGTVDLTSVIDLATAPYTSQTWTITSDTTEGEAFASFSLEHTVGANPSRLVIQTQFTEGEGVVYVQKDEYANPLDCNSYYCTSDEDCFNTARFIQLQCCSSTARYYVTVRNTGGVGEKLSFYFRITTIEEPDVIVIPASPSQVAPFVATPAVGVEGENYHFYRLDLSSSDNDNYQSLIVNFTRNVDDSRALTLMLNYGAKAGAYSGNLANSAKYPLAEGCHTYQTLCTVSGTQRCVLQVPHCELIPGSWYLSVYNADFDFTGPHNDEYRGYSLSVYLDSITTLTLGHELTTGVISRKPVYRQFVVSVSAADLEFHSGTSTDYYTNYLRVQVGAVTTSSTFTVYVNYDDVAGNGGCYNSVQSGSCVNGCVFDFFPCPGSDEFKLVSGKYFIGVNVGDQASFTIEASIQSESYSQIAPVTVTGDELTQVFFSTSVGSTQVAANVDGYYRYYAELSNVTARHYIIANLSVETVATGATYPSLEIWRDDCSQWSCATASSDGWCTIDAAGLSICTAQAGTYFLRVWNPSKVHFSLTLYQKEATSQTILNDQTITEEIFPYEYQQYVFSAVDVDSTITLDVSTTCGDVEVWIQAGTTAGPECEVDYCSTRNGEKACEIFLDTCLVAGVDYYITIRGTNQAFPGEQNSHLYLPIRYNVHIVQSVVARDSLAPSCSHIVDRESTAVPNQIIVDLETVNAFASLRFSLRIPAQLFQGSGFDSTGYAALYAHFNAPVGFNTEDGAPCAPFFNQYCEIFAGDLDYSCSFEILCPQAGRWYVWADAPRGSEVIVEKSDPVIPVIVPEKLYPATINGPTPAVDFDLPYRPNVQYYRVDVDPRQPNFRLKVQVYDVDHGTVRVTVVEGTQPTGAFCYVGLLDPSTAQADSETPYTYIVERCEAATTERVEAVWIRVEGIQQLCELHSIQYTLRVHQVAGFDDYRVDTEGCGYVEEGEYNFYRVNPRKSERLQDTVLHFEITNVQEDEVVTLFLNDNAGELASASCNIPIGSDDTGFIHSASASYGNDLSFDYACGYDDLYFSLYGTQADQTAENPEDIDYYLSVTKQPVRVTTIFNGVTHVVDNDDEDTCTHAYDYFVLEADDEEITDAYYLEVTVVGDATIWVNKNQIGGPFCYDSGSCTAGAVGACTAFHICGFEPAFYYITVESNGAYSLTAALVKSSTKIALKTAVTGVVIPGQVAMYHLDVDAADVPVGSRLSVEIYGVENGAVYGYIGATGNTGPYQTSSGSGACAIDWNHVSIGAGVEDYGYLTVDSCEVSAGRYYISLFGAKPAVRNCLPVTFQLRVSVHNYGITVKEQKVNERVKSQSVDLYSVDRLTQTPIRYYSFKPLGGSTETFAEVVVGNITGGAVRVRVSPDLPVPESTWIPGTRRALSHQVSAGATGGITSGARPYTTQPAFDATNGCGYFECTTSDWTGCQVQLFSCNFNTDITWYVSVEVVSQVHTEYSVNYDLIFLEFPNYRAVRPDGNHIGFIPVGTVESQFYVGQSAVQESIRFHIDILSGSGVYVTLRDHQCPAKATFSKEIYCGANYEDWRCDVEISTRAEHPGANDHTFFVEVTGTNVTYSIGYFHGRQNCHDFKGVGIPAGLEFCQGLITYTTWRVEDYRELDQSAECLFDQLYSHFYNQDCYNGVTPECNSTLRRFACYENFRRCDANGFQVGTCRKACEAVVYECANWFQTVDLEAYNCTSARYVHDLEGGACTGHTENAGFETGRFLGEDADEILYDQTLHNSASSLTAPMSLIFSLVAVLAFFWKL